MARPRLLTTSAPAISGKRMVSLPQNLITNEGTLYEDFEAAADWTAGNGSVANNNTAGQFKTGTQSVKLTTLAAGASATMLKTVNWDLSGSWQRMDLWFYLHNTTIADYGGSVLILLANDAGLTNYYRAWVSTAHMSVPGWYSLHCGKAHFGTVGAPSWNNPIVRVRLQAQGVAGKTVEVSFDSLKFGVTATPAVLMRFDDGYASQYATCYAYMKPRRLRGTLAWTTNTAFVTAAQLREMDAAGWAIANHTNQNAELPTLTEAQQEAAISGGKTTMVAESLGRCADYLCYPGGTSNADTTTAMNNLGCKTGHNGKLTDSVGCLTLALPFGPLFQIPSNGITNTTAVATFTGLVDRGIAGGYIMPFHWHDVGAAGNMTAADFRTCMDYVYTKKLAGQLVTLTVDDLYKLTTGPTRIPI